MKNFICLLILITAFASCAFAPLTPEQNAVRILRRSDAPINCKELGRVIAPGLGSLTEEGRDYDLKVATFRLGGNTVTILSRNQDNTIYGMAYKCPIK